MWRPKDWYKPHGEWCWDSAGRCHSCERAYEAGADAMFKALWKYVPVELQRCVFGKEGEDASN